MAVPNKAQLREDLDDGVVWLADFLRENRGKSLEELQRRDVLEKTQQVRLFGSFLEELNGYLARTAARHTSDFEQALAAAEGAKAKLLDLIRKNGTVPGWYARIKQGLMPRSSIKFRLFLEIRESLEKELPRPAGKRAAQQPAGRTATVEAHWSNRIDPRHSERPWHPKQPGKQCRLLRRCSKSADTDTDEEVSAEEASVCQRECDILFFFDEGFDVKQLAGHFKVPLKTLYRFETECREGAQNLQARLKRSE